MAGDKEPTVIKKYANRRLYNTGTSTYVTLDDLGEMVKAEQEFVVIDAKTGEDITRGVLTQIIFEQENRGPNLLPISFLRQLIRFYGDSMQALVPSYLDYSMTSLAREQEKLRDQMAKSLGANGFGALEEQVRRNMEVFEQTMRMFSPVPPDTPEARNGRDTQESRTEAGAQCDSGSETDTESEIEALRKQLSEVQDRLDRMSRRD